MDRTLLLGRAGSGKTRRLMEEVARRIRAGTDDRALLLVPTYGRAEHLKRSLLGLLAGDPPAFFDRTVVTFTSLAERVLGGSTIASLATPARRDALLRAALEEVRPPAFEGVRAYPGFRARLLGLAKEVKESGLPDPEAEAAVEALAASTPGAAARARVEAFAAVFRAWTRRLRETGLEDHEDFQRRLLEAIRAAAPGLPAALAGIEWLGVDGFPNFTRLQAEVVEALGERVPRAVLSLPDDPARPALFEVSRETRERLLSRGWREERTAGNRRAAPGAVDLGRLEEALFAAGDPVPAPPDAAGSVRLLRCADPADEADRVARTAALWIREEGVRPFEVLLVWRSLAAARGLLEEAFRRHAVPLRVFAARPLGAEPAVRAALDLARLALGEGDGEAALRAARSGLVAGTDAGEGDRLADLVAERGLPPSPADLLALARGEGLRRTAALLASLLPADGGAAAASRDPRRLAGEALAAWSVPDRLRPAWVPAQGPPDGDAAAVDAAALAALSRAAADAALSLLPAGEACAPAAFLEALEDAAARASFQPLDRRLHAVNAVDVEEARQWEARCVVVGGLLEGRFPRLPREDLLLRDADRRRANAEGRLRFAERLRAREEERFLFHVAATRARERLVLAWPAAGPSGEPLRRSPFLEEVLRIWPPGEAPLSESRAADPAPVPGEELSGDDLLRGALPRLAEPTLPGSRAAARAAGAAVLVDALASRARGRRLPSLAAAALLARDPVPRLRRARLRAPLVAPFRTSASALADFHQCPYLHFASRVLRLRSPARDAEEGLDPMRLGSVAHAALERWLRGGGAGDPGEAFDAALAEASAGLRPGLGDHARALRTRAAVAAFAGAEAARAAARPFAPRHFEMAFGGRGGGAAPPLLLRSGRRRIEVAGRFDRVDVAPDGGAVAVDYKLRWRGEGFGEEDLEEGLGGADLQVPLYLLALRDSLGLRPAGVEIAEIVSGVVAGVRVEGAPGSVAPGEGSAVLDGARVAALEAAVREAAGAAAEALARGEIPARPSDPERCGAGRCPFADLCRHEKWDPRGRGGPWR